MIKPFQIVWELIEFGLQALFLYVLALIIVVGLIAYVIADNKSKDLTPIPYNRSIQFGEKKIEEKAKGMRVERECIRLAGCRVLQDGTVEW